MSLVTYNFLDYKLTERWKSILCEGLKFAFLPDKLEYADFVNIWAFVLWY